MGKKDFRALRSFNKALETGAIAHAISSAYALGVDIDDINAVALLLDYPIEVQLAQTAPGKIVLTSRSWQGVYEGVDYGC